MGNCQCNASKTFYDVNAWQTFSVKKHYEIIRSLHDQTTILQKWKSCSNQNHFDYQARQENCLSYFPKIHHYGSVPSSGKNSEHSYVITGILSQLSTFNSLTNYQLLFILREILKGLKILFEKHKAFEVTQDMIWIDESGKPVIWFDQNIAKNKPAFPVKNKRHDFQEYTIRKLIDIVAKRTESGFAGYFPPQKLTSFYRAIQRFDQELSTSIFPIEKVKTKSTKANDKNKEEGVGDSFETSIVLQTGILNHPCNTPKNQQNFNFNSNANLGSTLVINTPITQSIRPYPNNSFGLQKIPSFTNLTQKSLSTKNSEYFSMMPSSTKNSKYFSNMARSTNSSENQLNRNFESRNSFGSPKNYQKLEQKNKLGKPFQVIERNALTVSRDPDEMLQELIKSQNIKFQ